MTDTKDCAGCQIKKGTGRGDMCDTHRTEALQARVAKLEEDVKRLINIIMSNRHKLDIMY